MPCAMTSGSGSRTCCPAERAMSAARPGQPAVRRGGALPLPSRHSLARPAGALRRLEECAHALLPLGEGRRLGADFPALGRRCRQRICHDRRHRSCAPISTAPAHKKDGGDEAIGRSRGGLTTKIHALVDALGNPTGFALSPGQAHDLEGADALLPGPRGRHPDRRQGVRRRGTGPCPAGTGRQDGGDPAQDQPQEPRPYDKDLYQARHLIEVVFTQGSIRVGCWDRSCGGQEPGS